MDYIESESEHHPRQVKCRMLIKMPRRTYYDSITKKLNTYHVANEGLLEQLEPFIKKVNADIVCLKFMLNYRKKVADITYIHTVHDGLCYLASVLNLYTKNSRLQVFSYNDNGHSS